MALNEFRAFFSGKRVVVRVVVTVLMFGLFLLLAPWYGAEQRDVAQRRCPGLDIPAEWDIVVIGHGKASEWHLGTVERNPVPFFVCLVIFFYCCVFLACERMDVRRSQRRHNTCESE